MDKTDIILSMLLLANSRISYRELAEKLDLSANAVHKRIQSLINLGIIRRFTTKISLSALQAIMIFIYGQSEATSIGDLHQTLGTHGSIWWVTVGGGNIVYIGAYLKRLSDAESLIDYVKREAQIPNPSFGLITPSPHPLPDTIENRLYPLDRQIISSLSGDSRKTIADIATEVGAASKTIRRRLSTMIHRGLLEFSIQWYPDASNDIITVVHIRLQPEADKTTVATVMEKYFPNLLFHYRFINTPNELFCIVWTNTMKELRDLQHHLVDEHVITSIVPNILYTGYIFDTWRDELVHEKGSLPRRRTG